jgi:hypothetical protein
MRDLFPKQKTKFVDAVVGADRSMFGEDSSKSNSSKSTTSSSSSSSEVVEKDLDHEEDVNILGRIERELRRMEAEENLSNKSK